MILRRDPTKALQMGFLAVLAIATGQVAWWILDQRTLAWSEQDRVVDLYESNAASVTAFVGLLNAGEGPSEGVQAGVIADVVAGFPHLAFDPVAGAASVRPDAIADLADEVASRINRYRPPI